MSSKPVKIIVPILVVLLLAGGVFWWWQSRDSSDAAHALSGTIESTDYQVSALIGGRVKEVAAKEGDEVKAGDVLVRLDDEALRVQVDAANEAVEAAKSTVRLLEDSRAPGPQVDAARAQQRQAEAGGDPARLRDCDRAARRPRRHCGDECRRDRRAGADAPHAHRPGRSLPAHLCA